jgi:hypothetical protein
MIRAHLVLADFAETDSTGGKVHLLGGGWTVLKGAASPHAVVVFLKVPTDQADRAITVTLRLVSKESRAVVEQLGPGGMQRLEITGQVVLNIPPEWDQSVDLDAIFAINLSPLLLSAGTYTWAAEIDGKEAATTDFVVRT